MTHLSIPVRRLAWGTDWHLNFLKPAARQAFIQRIAGMEADAFAITGDISDGSNLEQDLRRIGNTITKPVFVLLGNHDRYHSSFAPPRRSCSVPPPRIHICTGSPAVNWWN